MTPPPPPSLSIYTHKDGVLARLAHDLQLSLLRFEVELEQGQVHARFVLSSLRVDGAIEAGALRADALSERDRAQILHNAIHDVLQAERYPEARFEGELGGEAGLPRVHGELSLRGKPRPVQLELARAPEQVVARASLVPSRWAIRPFKALAGAIRLADRVDVVLTLPLTSADAAGDLQALSRRWQLG